MVLVNRRGRAADLGLPPHCKLIANRNCATKRRRAKLILEVVIRLNRFAESLNNIEGMCHALESGRFRSEELRDSAKRIQNLLQPQSSGIGGFSETKAAACRRFSGNLQTSQRAERRDAGLPAPAARENFGVAILSMTCFPLAAGIVFMS